MKKDKKIFKEIEAILFSYKKYEKLNENGHYDDLLTKIGIALEMVKECKDYNFIELRYFERLCMEDIAEEMGIDVRSVYNMRKRLLDKLKLHFKINRLI